MKLLLPSKALAPCQKKKNAKFKKIIKCSGCGCLYGGWTSYYDHAPNCVELKEKQELIVDRGLLI